MTSALPEAGANQTRRGPEMSQAIDRRDWSAAAHRGYVRECVHPMKPVVLRGALDGIPAWGKWTPSFFKTRFGDLVVQVDGKACRMADHIDRVMASTPENPAPYLNYWLAEDWPESLKADVPAPACTRPNWVESRWFPSRYSYQSLQGFIGGAGAHFPFLHYDHWHLNTWLMQLYGVKEYVAFAPDQTPFMYPIGGAKENVSSVSSVEAPDLAKFPLFAHARGLRFKLRPGETLFMPAGWWHTVKILSPSITVSVSGASSGNWKAFSRDLMRAQRKNNPVKAAFVGAYLSFYSAAMETVGLIENLL